MAALILSSCVALPCATAGPASDDPCGIDRESLACNERGGSTVQVYEDYDKRVRSHESVTPLGSEVFGENISLYNGATEFRVVDIDLPGNGPPVQLARRFKVEAREVGDPLGGFGAWDLDVPYVHGTFVGDNKWNIGQGGNTNRCSSAWFPANPHDFSTREIWSGFHVHLPGEGDREFYPRIRALDHPLPNDGHNYFWVARDNLRFRCLTNTDNGYPGQGFLLVDGAGTKYWFDVGLERAHGYVQRKMGFSHIAQFRTRVYLMASRVEDRFGNWVEYQYSGSGPTTRLDAILASDGRRIDVAYESSQGYARINSATAHGRAWSYAYASASLGAPGRHPLSTVTLPDGVSQWIYGFTGQLSAESGDGDHPYGPGCPRPITFGGNFSFSTTHPAGATGTFVFQNLQHARSGVPLSACVALDGGAGNVNRLEHTYYFQNFSLLSKTVSGVGVGTSTWNYNYGEGDHYLVNHVPPCLDPVACPESKTVTVNNPDGTSTLYDFGVRFAWNESPRLQ